MKLKKIITFSIIFCLFSLINPVLGEMSSSNYIIQADSLNFSGSDATASANYQLKSTVGEIGTGETDSANYKTKAGYRYMVEAAATSEGETVTTGGGGIPPPETIPPVISNIQYTAPDEETLIIEWETDEPSATELDFGLSPEYELGKIEVRPEDLTKKHKIIIYDLKPDTQYFFRPRAKDLQGNETVDKGFVYSTPDTLAPTNVSSLKATPSDKTIILEWKNPDDKDFAGVRIQRSLSYFPLDKNEGENIYSGKGQIFIDRELENGKKHYYTVFSYDENGNFSSGAIIYATPQAPAEIPAEIPPAVEPGVIPVEILPYLPSDLTPPIPKEKIETLDLSKIFSFEMAKGTIRIQPDEDNKIRILPNVALKLSIAKEKLSPFLKSIIATIGDSSYLLKINNKTNAYETSFITPGSIGEYALSALVLVYQDGKMQVASGDLKVEENGYVYKGDVIASGAKQSRGLMSGIAAVVSFFRNDKKEKRITDAEVTLYQFYPELGTWGKWLGTRYFQVNPEFTDNIGEYAFAVNPGKYYLTVYKEGYRFLQTPPFEAENLVNQKIALKKLSLWKQIKISVSKIIKFRKTLFTLVALIIFLILLKRRKR